MCYSSIADTYEIKYFVFTISFPFIFIDVNGVATQIFCIFITAAIIWIVYSIIFFVNTVNKYFTYYIGKEGDTVYNRDL